MNTDFLHIAELRAEAELEQILSAPSASNVLSRWERKSLKSKKEGASGALPSAGSADRFIPSRSINRDVQLCNLQNESTENSPLARDAEGMPSAQMLRDSVFESQGAQVKILAFKDKPKPAEAEHLNQMRVLYSQNRTTAAQPKRKCRAVSSSAERILDAPDLSDDFYLNLLDWSARNTLAVALGQSVYLWNAESGDIDLLTELEGADNSVTSLSWSADGAFLAVGSNSNAVHLWNVEAKKQLRTMRGHSARVGALAWNNHVLSTGSRDSMIFNNDVRIAQHTVGSLRGHSLEVCGLKWSPDGSALASGGNDNVCHIWDASSGASRLDAAPRFSFAQHTAAVKALAWCPFQRHVLATGAGTADRHIRLFNTQTGALLQAMDTESQVCSLQWAPRERELLSAHGFSQNQLTVWRADDVSAAGSLVKMADLSGHTARILHTAVSPDGTTVCSAGADETLRFWKVWDAAPKKGVPAASIGKAAPGRIGSINIR